jgi:RNA polymerase sigma-70 factor (ECF subfamily)
MDELAPDSTETRGLLEQAGAGATKAFDRLIDRHRPALRRFVALRLGPELGARVDASDIVQETQLEAFRRLEDYLERRPMPFGLWLRKTAYERLLMLRRRHLAAGRRTVGREVALPARSSLSLARQLLASTSTPSERLVRQELVRRVQQAVAQLADSDREILLMRNFEESSYQDIACLLGIDPAAARKRHGRALARLARRLASTGFGESQL